MKFNTRIAPLAALIATCTLGAAAHAQQVPDSQQPSPTDPNVTVPEEGEGQTVPQDPNANPGGQVPGGTVDPNGTVPGTTNPDGTVPGTTNPNGTVPGNTDPNSTTGGACGQVTIAGELAQGVVCASVHDIPVQINGEFGASMTLSITEPSGATTAVVVPRAANMCAYLFNWQITKKAVLGTYTFSMAGANGSNYAFVINLVDPSQCTVVRR